MDIELTSQKTPVFADGTPVYGESIHWLYEPGALTPLARREKGQLHYVVSDHMGTPRELLTEKGDVAWANRLSTWGKQTRYRLAANDDRPTCNLRFAGQYADEESGLHYNRHRYYDSETGQYLSPDPIGLVGGLNPYGYVHNPLGWVDPLELACCPPKDARNKVRKGQRPKTKDQRPKTKDQKKLQELMHQRKAFLVHNGMHMVIMAEQLIKMVLFMMQILSLPVRH